MSNHPNRSQAEIAIDTSQPSRREEHSSRHPEGSVRCGVVRRGDETGTLIRWVKTDLYSMLIGDRVIALDQRRVRQELGIQRRKPGPQPTGRKGRGINLYLDHDSMTKAARIGGGSISEGVRRAIREYGGPAA